ncbi:pentapeptide repeat-containing protein [Actinomadura logoneensis]|uniref:Pentapeptide repeat-containing protein n=1 Tax=Actinomadura logoneensis TaxID=2293572 RepID=A0A372JBN8_9ACTN|nr:pentapeptide repeat-containing protein [Actinomadura logoneensis]RFU37256.1 pentapeptide repeat-containing protein [Actinomadura logoneensis]
MTKDGKPTSGSADKPGGLLSWRGRREAERRAGLWPIGRALTVATLAAVGGLAAVMVAVLAALGFPHLEHTRTLPVPQLLDVLKFVLGTVAGVGALFALVMAYRRQCLAEDAHHSAQHDATERRVTELYNAAATQLGSDKAPVRLTALYTLERLANANPDHRQTIVNIICAYLRMPFTPPATPKAAEAQDVEKAREAVRRYRARHHRTELVPSAPAPDNREELQVRLTAQRILQTHLRRNAIEHWSDIALDMTNATLIDFTLTGGRLTTADFRSAYLHGDTDFSGTVFAGHADFSEVTFTQDAAFRYVTFAGHADFEGATFTGRAEFDRVNFTEDAVFRAATFAGHTDDRVDFTRYGSRLAAALTGDSYEVTILRDTGFISATFAGHADFEGATFTGHANFYGATFTRDAYFHSATFTRDTDFGMVSFTKYADFNEVTFIGEVKCGGAKVRDRKMILVPPPGWRIEPAEGTGGVLVPDAPPQGNSNPGGASSPGGSQAGT